MGLALLHSLRPRHWIKQVFVFPGLVFSGKLLQPSAVGHALTTAFAFCCAASAGYLVNDLCNLQEDRENPRTAQRPLARGDLSPAVAAVTALFLLGFALVAAGFSGTSQEVMAYLVVSFLYSGFLKKIAVLDVAALVFFYLTRLLAGCRAVDVPPSPWLLLCGGSLALVLSWGKRLGEPQSPYPPRVLRKALPILAAITVALYAAYTLAASTRKHFGLGLVVTLPWVALGLARYVTVATAGTADPTTALFRDRHLATLTGLWAVHVLALVVAAG